MGQAASQPLSTPNAGVAPLTSPSADPQSSKAECPVEKKPVPLARCPVNQSSSSINPLNQMPSDLSQTPTSYQSSPLPTDRVSSSIPRDHLGTTWDYPSPQQFYNALVRKGWETPEEHIQTMVEIHNFLNEAAWNEVLKWEKRVNPA